MPVLDTSTLEDLSRLEGGVRFTAPPLDVLPSLTKSINDAVATLDPDDLAALVGVATDKGVNAAFVLRTGNDWNVVTWLGKDWGAPKPSWGVGVMKRWKRS